MSQYHDASAYCKSKDLGINPINKTETVSLLKSLKLGPQIIDKVDDTTFLISNDKKPDILDNEPEDDQDTVKPIVKPIAKEQVTTVKNDTLISKYNLVLQLMYYRQEAYNAKQKLREIELENERKRQNDIVKDRDIEMKNIMDETIRLLHDL